MPQMYIKLRNDIPVAYRYGDEWVATQLMIDGGYSTPEEAIDAWSIEHGYGRMNHRRRADHEGVH